MRELGQQDLIDLVEGSYVFSSGGGGDPVVCLSVLERLLEKRCPVRLVGPEEVPDSKCLVSLACAGATANAAYHSDAAVATLSKLEKFLGVKAFAVVPAELGGLSTMAAVDVAARHGIPVVDADGAGRAVPEIHLQAFKIENPSLSAPACVADIDAKKVVFIKQADEPRSMEKIVRDLAAKWNQMVYVAKALSMSTRTRAQLIPNTLSTSIRVGMLLRKAVDPMKAVLKETASCTLFEGVVTKAKNEDRDGFTWTTLEMDALRENSKSTMEIRAKNEFLVAYRDGRLVALAPDVITAVSLETCKCLPAEKIVEGNKLVIVGISASASWRSPKGLKLWDEVLRSSGISEKYAPIEELAAQNPFRHV